MKSVLGRRAAVLAPGRRGKPSSGKRPTARLKEHGEVLKALRGLSPDKQSRVFEEWPGISGETPEGLKVTARTTKELRRFTKPKDEGMLAWVRSFTPGDVFYDIGANVGGVSLTVAGIHGGSIPIVAIEPSFGSFESLARNLSLNGLLGSTIPLQVALLDETGLQPLNYRSTAAGTSLHAVGKPLDHEGHEFVPVEIQHVPTYRLDDLIEMLRLPAPTVVKIDVDGYEEPVLRGALRTLEAGTIRELNVEIVDHDRAGTRLRTVTQLLVERGYELTETFRHGDETGYVADYLFCLAGARDSDELERAGPAGSEVASTDRPPEDGAGAARPGSGEGAGAALTEVPAGARTRDERASLKQRQAALKERNAALAGRNTELKERNAELKVANIGLRGKLQEVEQELADLRRSYHFSRAGNKVDLRELAGFSDVARGIMEEGRSGMNYDRLYALWQAVQGAPADLPIVEVGAYRGGSAKFIAEALRHARRSPRFFVCDTFAGHPRSHAEFDLAAADGDDFSDTSADSVARYLDGHHNVELVVGDIVETAAHLPGDSFGFVHLDVDLYEATDFCLRFFAPRLARGAVMLVDDYGVLTCPGGQKAVDEFVAEADDFRLFHLLSGQALLFRVS